MIKFPVLVEEQMKQLILNFISTFVLVFLLCGSPDAFVAARNLSRTLYPPTEADDARPIYFYGFINNEHYKHFMPGSRTISAVSAEKVEKILQKVQKSEIPSEVESRHTTVTPNRQPPPRHKSGGKRNKIQI